MDNIKGHTYTIALSHQGHARRWPAALPLCLALAMLGGGARSVGATSFTMTNLVTDDQTVNAALITDVNLVNAWGIASSPTSPFWVSDNGTGVATLYRVDPVTNLPIKQALTVSIPGAGNVTGQ